MLDELAPNIKKLKPDVGEPSSPTKTLTVLTGAGSSLYAGAPSTNELTNLLAQREFSGSILRILQSHSSQPEKINFEDVLHVLEELELFTDTNTDLREVLCLQPFLRLQNFFGEKSIAPIEFRSERFAVIEMIGKRIFAMNHAEWFPLYSWIRPFVDEYDIHWYTLNYDLLADIAMYALSVQTKKQWFDGFGGGRIDMIGSQTFRPEEYANPDVFNCQSHLTLGHLHGSVAYTYRLEDERLAHHRPCELVRAPSREEASKNWKGFHAAALANQVEIGDVSPIISGLRKTEKLNVRPYGNYLHGFVQSLRSSPFLMIIGYGGSDPHINYWLREYIDMHHKRISEAHVIEVTAPGSDPNLSVIGKLGSYDLRWEKHDTDIYLNHLGVRGLLMTTGISANATNVPGRLMLDHLSKNLVSP